MARGYALPARLNIALKSACAAAIDQYMKAHELNLPHDVQIPWILYIATGLVLMLMTWLLIWA